MHYRRILFILVSIIVLCSVLLYYTMSMNNSGLDSYYVDGFKKLYVDDPVRGREVLANISSGEEFFREILFRDKLSCLYGYVSSLRFRNVLFLYNCSYVIVRVNKRVENVSGVRVFMQNIFVTGRQVYGSTTSSMYSYSSYVRVYSGFLELRTSIPMDSDQGVVLDFISDSDRYYRIANIPYVYLKIEYGRGIGNASFAIDIVFSINNVNLTYPYSIEYRVNTNTSILLTPVGNPMLERSIIEDSGKLEPLLKLDSGNNVTVKIYINIYVESRGEYDASILVGYPAIRVVENNPS